MRYALALYCSDLTDSSHDFIPVGVIVVDENAKRYAFQGLQRPPNMTQIDEITQIMWNILPIALEQRFLEYTTEPNCNYYKERIREYHGFISQLIVDWSQSTICFSDSITLEGNEDIEEITQKLFQEKVLRTLN